MARMCSHFGEDGVVEQVLLEFAQIFVGLLIFLGQGFEIFLFLVGKKDSFDGAAAVAQGIQIRHLISGFSLWGG